MNRNDRIAFLLAAAPSAAASCRQRNDAVHESDLHERRVVASACRGLTVMRMPEANVLRSRTEGERRRA